LMEIGIPLGIGFGALFSRDALRSGENESDESARRIFVGAGVVAMVLALLMSKSRMGIASLIFATILVMTADRALRPQRRSRTDPRGHRGRRVILGSILIASAVAVWIGIEPLVERFARVHTDFENGRLPLWQAAVAMFRDQPLVGNGWGSYRYLLNGYRIEPTGLKYFHVHNEYLEVAADAGLVGLGVVGVLVGLLLRRIVSALRTPLEESTRALVVAMSIALLSIVVHSIADFGLRIPGVALVFVALLAIFVRVTADPAVFERDQPRRRHRRRRRRNKSE
jgi:O-antigen ligase